MSYFHLLGMTCRQQTGDEHSVDEPYLQWRIDKRGRYSNIWSPSHRKIKSGISRDLTDIEPIYFKNSIQLRLMDENSTWEDNIGSVSITKALSGSGEREIHFSGGGTRYTISFFVAEESYPIAPYHLIIHDIECLGAKDKTEDPFIVVNNITIWGPESMKTGERFNLGMSDGVIVPFHARAKIELRQFDSNIHQDQIGSTTFIVNRASHYDHHAQPFYRKWVEDHWGDESYTITLSVSEALVHV